MTYFAADHYWIVAGSTTQVYASKAVGYVPVANATYVKWLSDPTNKPTTIDTEANLMDVLLAAGVPVPAGKAASDTLKTAQIGQVNTVLFKIAFNHENRIRTLAGQAQVTVPQFIAAIKALI